MNAKRQSNILVRHFLWIPEAINGQPAFRLLALVTLENNWNEAVTNGWKKNFDVTAGNQLCLCEHMIVYIRRGVAPQDSYRPYVRKVTDEG